MNEMSIQVVDDDEIRFFVNEEMVATANHDEHGYAGMEAMEDMFHAIAKELEIELITF